jgi:hypothetical protein
LSTSNHSDVCAYFASNPRSHHPMHIHSQSELISTDSISLQTSSKKQSSKTYFKEKTTNFNKHILWQIFYYKQK